MPKSSVVLLTCGMHARTVQVDVPKRRAQPEGLLGLLKQSVDDWVRAGVSDPFFAVVAYKQ